MTNATQASPSRSRSSVKTSSTSCASRLNQSLPLVRCTAANVAIVDPLAAAGKKVYDSESCDACHGENGVGTNAGPKLAGAIAQKSAEELSNLLRHPTAKMIEGEMKPVDVSRREI